METDTEKNEGTEIKIQKEYKEIYEKLLVEKSNQHIKGRRYISIGR